MFKKLAATSLVVALSISAVSVSVAKADMMHDQMMMKRHRMMMMEKKRHMMMMEKKHHMMMKHSM